MIKIINTYMRNEFLLLFILFLLFRLFRISITLNTLLLLIDDIPRAEEKRNEKCSSNSKKKKKKNISLRPIATTSRGMDDGATKSWAALLLG